MIRLLIATTSGDKLREIRQILAAAPVETIDLDAIGPIEPPEETGATFEENARLKALHYAGASGLLTVAEDSGLAIDALGGEPGVRSARFLGENASYPERFAEIFRRLTGVPLERRTARFICALAVAEPGRIRFEARGTVEGRIAEAPAGTGGFGYDPIFVYPPLGRTLAEAAHAKTAVSHRAAAFRDLARWLDALRAPTA